MRLFFWLLFVGPALTMSSGPDDEARNNNNNNNKQTNQVLDCSSYNEIVRDLIKSWESPIVYLKDSGYLPSNYEDTSQIKPDLDALLDRIQRHQHKAKIAKSGNIQTQVVAVDIQPKEQSPQNKLKTLMRINNRFNPALTARQQRNSYQDPAVQKAFKQLLAEHEPKTAKASHDLNVEQFRQLKADHEPSYRPSKEQPLKAEPTRNFFDMLASHDLNVEQAFRQLQTEHELRPSMEQPLKAEPTRHFDDTLERMIMKTAPQPHLPLDMMRRKPDEGKQLESKPSQNNARPQSQLEPPASFALSDNVKSNNLNSASDSSSVLEVTSKLANAANMHSIDLHSYDDYKAKAYWPSALEPKGIGDKSSQPYTRYLNWDMDKRRLKVLSPIDQEAHLNHIVKMFAQKQEREDYRRQMDNRV